MLQPDSIATVDSTLNSYDTGAIANPVLPNSDVSTTSLGTAHLETSAAIVPLTPQNQIPVALDSDDPDDLLTGGLTRFDNTPQNWNLDVDGDNIVSAFSDGIMIVRYLSGDTFAGDALTEGVIGANATRTTAEIRTYLEQGLAGGFLDIDGNNITNADSDGMLIVRHLVGSIFVGDALIDGVIGSNATRTTAEIRTYLSDAETLDESSQLPIITLTSVDNDLGESNNPGQVVISRTGALDQALTVTYSLAGTATLGSDYQIQADGNTLNGSINFAVGESSKTLDFIVIDDNEDEDSETIFLSLITNSSYRLSINTTATLAIEDNDNTSGIQGGTVPDSDDYQIDALTQGRKWDLGDDNVISYSFLTDSAAPSYSGPETVSEISDALKSTLRNLIETVIEPWLNLDFQEVSDNADSFGTLRFMLSDGPGYAYAYSPNNTSDRGGDVHFSPNYDNNINSNGFLSGPGSHGYVTLMHETLHALGLKHAGDYDDDGDSGPFVPVAEDHTGNTVMSYFSPLGGGRAITPMPYDLKALHYIYGVKDFNESNTTYVFDRVDRYVVDNQQSHAVSTNVKQTLWDTNGIDTLDFSGLMANGSGYRFDLNEGQVLTTQAAYNSNTNRLLFDVNQTNISSDYGTWIAFNAVIENLINSTSDDEIFANNAANRFSGYQFGTSVGDDVYWYTDATDILDLQSYSLDSITRLRDGNDELITLGVDGSIRLKDYYLGSQMQILLG